MANGQRVGYARVSTTGQDLSLQKDRLADCDKIYEEKVSGARGTVRPALEEAMNYVRDGDVFVVSNYPPAKPGALKVNRSKRWAQPLGRLKAAS